MRSILPEKNQESEDANMQAAHESGRCAGLGGTE